MKIAVTVGSFPFFLSYSQSFGRTIMFCPSISASAEEESLQNMTAPQYIDAM